MNEEKKKGMKTNNVIVDKTFDFAVRIVKLYQQLTTEKKEFVLSKQILRSGTSIGANIEEAVGAISKKEFIAKTQIAYKEARETKYWLKLLLETEYIDKEAFDKMIVNIEEIIRIIVAILKSSKNEN